MSDAVGAAPETVSKTEYDAVQQGAAILQKQLAQAQGQMFEASHTIPEFQHILEQSIARSAYLRGQVQITTQQRDGLAKELESTRETLATVTDERDALKAAGETVSK